jgi:hypothetical protein
MNDFLNNMSILLLGIILGIVFHIGKIERDVRNSKSCDTIGTSIYDGKRVEVEFCCLPNGDVKWRIKK